MGASPIETARVAFAEKRWVDALAAFREAPESSMEREDLEANAITAAMVMDHEACAEAWSRAYDAWLGEDDSRAFRCAFFLAMWLLSNGLTAHGSGWMGRAASTLPETDEPQAEHGLMMIPQGRSALEGGDAEKALGIFQEASALGQRFRDPNLLAVAKMGFGWSLIRLGRTDEGLSSLDEAMVAVTSGGTTPIIYGVVYCSVILACIDAFDIQRAHEWTRALDAWTGAQQGLVPFRGQCLVHRSQIKQMQGDWDDALADAEFARDRFADPPGQPAIGLAYYQLGEVHRERGAFDDAERAYRDAHRAGHPAQPGLALLSLARGRSEAALKAVTGALAEASDDTVRARILPAAVEIAVANGDLERAREMADALAELADGVGAPMLRAASAAATGAVQLAEGDAQDARAKLREAQRLWLELDVPYEVARTRVRIAEASRALGDHDTATIELEAATHTFIELGAAPALAALGAPAEVPAGLTPREVEVLKLVATGMTNPAIADELVISRKTVARHLSNIFVKTGVSTRAEATAYAYEHGLT